MQVITCPLSSCFVFGQFGPDLAPVVRTEIAASEFAAALLLNASAIRNRYPGLAPLVDGGFVLVEPFAEGRLKALAVK